MSPEQAMGDRELDARSDIYSLGAMLYEMLTGDPPYTGSTAQAIVAKVITEKAAPITTARDTVPPHVAAAVHKALAKLPADRFHTAAEFAEALARPGFTDTTAFAAPAGWSAPAGRKARIRLAAIIGGVALGGVTAGWMLRPRPAPDLRIERFEILNGVLADGGFGISPDGRTVVASVRKEGGGYHLITRRLDALETATIPGSDNSGLPAFSPDGRELAFSSPRGVGRVTLGGGAAVTTALAIPGNSSLEWGADGFWYFSNQNGGVSRVAVTGGQPEIVIQPDSTSGELLLYVDALPGARAVLLSRVRAEYAQNEVAVLDLRTKTMRTLVRGTMGKYDGVGHLLYATSDGVLFAAPFDPDKAEISGEPVAVARDIWLPGFGWAAYDVSPSGTLIYQTVAGLSEGQALVFVGRDGTRRPFPLPKGQYNNLGLVARRSPARARNSGRKQGWRRHLRHGPPRQRAHPPHVRGRERLSLLDSRWEAARLLSRGQHGAGPDVDPGRWIGTGGGAASAAEGAVRIGLLAGRPLARLPGRQRLDWGRSRHLDARREPAGLTVDVSRRARRG
jgi:serine/threonine-protein kinase